ncbi:glycosyltransferase family 4 protein [Terribacillus sp. FSL K6-0262]|uniref:glycosyltransferase family 4 protein n=1 Tax=Terribacillus sp. FSL K6-0262 TaxID=2921447 RepID=UPI0030EE08E9
MRVAIVHDWLVTYAGAEKVLTEILRLYPEADLFSLVDHFNEEDRKKIFGKKANTTFIQNLPLSKTKYRNYLSLMPFAIEQLDLSGYDLIISSSHAVAKGVITGPDQLHISYVHSPIRYAWDLQYQYLKEANLNKGFKSLIVKRMLKKIRDWDYRTSNGVDYFLSNSDFIGKRIWKVYRRESYTIYPPVEINSFNNDISIKREDFYLTASRMVPYKKIDLIVDAFNEMPTKKLIVIGTGPDFKKIQAKAGPNVTLLGYQSFKVLKEHMQKAKAFVFAAEEDFGITPVEAQACGTPVIAYGKGGLLETVHDIDSDKPTGVFFRKQTIEDIQKAVSTFEKNYSIILSSNCRSNAERFSPENFRDKLENYVSSKMKEKWKVSGGYK